MEFLFKFWTRSILVIQILGFQIACHARATNFIYSDNVSRARTLNGFAKNSALTKHAPNPLSSSALLIDHYKKTLYGDSTSSSKPISNPRQRKLVNLAQNGYFETSGTNFRLFNLEKRMIERKNEKPNQISNMRNRRSFEEIDEDHDHDSELLMTDAFENSTELPLDGYAKVVQQYFDIIFNIDQLEPKLNGNCNSQNESQTSEPIPVFKYKLDFY